MNDLLKKIALGGFVCGLSSITPASEATHWGYEKDISPEHWAELSENFKMCSAGKNQTPIDITDAYVVTEKHHIDIQYNVSPEHIVFNGHTVQVNTNTNDDYLILDHEKFYLKQFHFHTPSENTIEGKSYPLELHFVNANADGQLTVLAVMFEFAEANSEITKLWESLSKNENDTKKIKNIINLGGLLPKHREYYRFTGSLTTPPCDEGVNWIVLKQPISFSEEQLAKFKEIIKQQHNNRPLQSTNGRIVIDD